MNLPLTSDDHHSATPTSLGQPQKLKADSSQSLRATDKAQPTSVALMVLGPDDRDSTMHGDDDDEEERWCLSWREVVVVLLTARRRSGRKISGGL